MVDNVRVKTLNCARIFKMLHVGAFILHSCAHCIQNSNMQVLSDSQSERVGCGPWLFGEEVHLTYTSWNGNAALFIGYICFPSYEINKLMERQKFKWRILFKRFNSSGARINIFSPLSFPNYYYFFIFIEKRHKSW